MDDGGSAYGKQSFSGAVHRRHPVPVAFLRLGTLRRRPRACELLADAEQHRNAGGRDAGAVCAGARVRRYFRHGGRIFRKSGDFFTVGRAERQGRRSGGNGRMGGLQSRNERVPATDRIRIFRKHRLRRRGSCEHRIPEHRTERNRFAVGFRHRSHTVGTCRAAHPMRVSDGAHDRVVLPQKRRQPSPRTHTCRILRTVHHSALHRPHRNNNPHHAHSRRSGRDGRHFQLDSHALDTQHTVFCRIHDIRRIVFRSIRNHSAQPHSERY